MKVSVIVSYYKNQQNLELILMALSMQTADNFEVIVSEDDNNADTISFLNRMRKIVTYPILHTKQDKDLGFRKTMMLNKSIQVSNGETLVFIDGDCIPHKNFVEQYIKNTEDGYMLKGRRVMLSEKISKQLLRTKNLSILQLKNILFSNSNKKKEALYTAPLSLILSMENKGLLGCNWGIKKKHLLEINGFDEDYVHAAVGEDTDVEWRLKGIGITSKSMKNKAIVYHLYHKRSYSKEDVDFNNKLLAEKIENKNYRCINGINNIE